MCEKVSEPAENESLFSVSTLLSLVFLNIIIHNTTVSLMGNGIQPYTLEQ